MKDLVAALYNTKYHALTLKETRVTSLNKEHLYLEHTPLYLYPSSVLHALLSLLVINVNV